MKEEKRRESGDEYDIEGPDATEDVKCPCGSLDTWLTL